MSRLGVPVDRDALEFVITLQPTVFRYKQNGLRTPEADSGPADSLRFDEAAQAGLGLLR